MSTLCSSEGGFGVRSKGGGPLIRAASSSAVILGPKTSLMVFIKGWCPSPHLFLKSSRSKAQTIPPAKPILLMYSDLYLIMALSS